MKKIIFVLVLILFPISIFAQSVATSPATFPAYVNGIPSLFFHDGYRGPIAVTASAGQRLPVDIAGFSIGSVTVNAQAGPVYEDSSDATSPARIDSAQRVLVNVGSQTVNTNTSPFFTDEFLGSSSQTIVVLITSSAYQIPMMANTRAISIYATGTFQVMTGTTTFEANMPELPNGFKSSVTPTSILAIKTGASETYGVVYQVGR